LPGAPLGTECGVGHASEHLADRSRSRDWTESKGRIEMTAIVAGLVGAAFLILIGVCYVATRRVERDLDYSDYAGSSGTRHDERLAHTARLIANVIVAAP
jgi:hypothetical protein